MSVDRPNNNLRAVGFTLIELMVTIALVALLAAVAYPTYVTSVQKARRADARSALTEAAQRLERYYTENNDYRGANFCNSGDAGCTPFNQIRSRNTENKHYQLDFFLGPTASTYTIQAVPQNAQSTDACGTFTLDQRGVRGAALADPALCW